MENPNNEIPPLEHDEVDLEFPNDIPEEEKTNTPLPGWHIPYNKNHLHASPSWKNV